MLRDTIKLLCNCNRILNRRAERNHYLAQLTILVVYLPARKTLKLRKPIRNMLNVITRKISFLVISKKLSCNYEKLPRDNETIIS